MSIFRFGKERTKAKSLKQAAFSNSSASDSFILEPILTPTAGFDGGDSAPDLAILRPDDQRFHLQDWIDTSIDRPTVEQAVEISSADPVELIAFVDDAQLARDGSIPDLLEELNLSPTPPLFESGVFTVGASGQVSIDFLFDGGGYEGQLAVFSLEGLERFELGSEEFIREAAYRALSHSELGYVVINDVSDSARFSGAFTHEGDVNGGDYQGVRTFAMRPGDSVGFMLVPNSTVQNVFDHPEIEGNQRPLFSLATANPNDEFQSGQVVDVTGEGNTFVFEDLRMDGHSDRDYNDVIFQVRGATGDAAHLDQVIAPNNDWRSSNVGKALIAYTESYLNPDFNQIPSLDAPQSSQPLIGIIDTGFAINNPDIDYSRLMLGHDWVNNDDMPLLQTGEGSEHGTHVLGIIGATQENGIGIDGINDDAPIWIGRAIGSGQWADSLIEFVDAAKASEQPNAVVNLSFDLAQINPDGSITTRYEFTPEEVAAIEYARQHNVLIVAAAGNDGGGISALGEASRKFDNVITVGAAEALSRADYSSYGYELDILAPGGTSSNPILSTVADGTGTMAGTSVATAKVTGVISQVWAANPSLSYLQVIETLKSTAKDLGVPNWDAETGAGLLNVAAAISLAKATPGKDMISEPSEIVPEWLDESVFTPIERAVNGAPLVGKKIVLDPGHGITNTNFDPGALGVGTTEAAETLIQAGILAAYLRQRGANVTVVDEPLSLAQIGQRASGSDLFVSLHLNAFNKKAQGHEVLVRTNATSKDLALASAINNELDTAFPDREIPNRSVKRQDLAVLRNAPINVPAVLTEALFIDAPGMNRANVVKAAEAIARGVEKFLTGTTTPTPIKPLPQPRPNPTPDWQRAIDQAYANSPVNLGVPLGGYADAARSPQGTVGKFRNYQNGTIHWTQKYGAIPIWSDLQREYNQYSRPDGSGGWLGFPTRREYDWNGGKRTDFEGGYIFWNGQRAKAYRLGEMPPGTQPIRTGRVNSRVGTIPLNLRSSAVVAANNKIGALSIGTSFKVLEQVNGGSYSTDAGNRTDWLKIQLNSGQQGFVAGYYVDIDSNNGGGSGGNAGNGSTLSIPVDWGSAGYRQNNPLWRAGFAPSSFSPPNPKLGAAKGNCTWYANGRLRQLGYSSRDLDKLVGMAYDWDSQARNAGIPTSRIPQVGSIAQWENGHVAVVEQVNPNGTIVISESSYTNRSGSPLDYLYNTRTISASNPSLFIHVRR